MVLTCVCVVIVVCLEPSSDCRHRSKTQRPNCDHNWSSSPESSDDCQTHYSSIHNSHCRSPWSLSGTLPLLSFTVKPKHSSVNKARRNLLVLQTVVISSSHLFIYFSMLNYLCIFISFHSYLIVLLLDI